MDTKALRQKILDLAIRGKLVPQDPSDEPASALLERIREQKRQMVRDGKLKAKDIKNDTVIFVGEDNLHYEKFPDGSVKCIEDEIPFEVPSGWEWTRLNQIASFSGGKTPSTSVKEYWGKDTLWVTSKDMKSKYIYSTLMMLSKQGSEIMQKYPVNTLLMVTRSGILRHTLPVAILKKESTINQDLKAFSLVMPELAEYIYNCLKGMEPRLLKTYVKSGVTVENINFDEFQSALIPLAPITEMQRILNKIDSVMKYVDNLEKEKTELAEFVSISKSHILDLAIRGKLVPQDPNDEPASVLLERIRAEKEELIKQGKIKRDKGEGVIFKSGDSSHYERIPAGWEIASFSQLNYFQTSTINPSTYKDEYFELYSVPNYDLEAPEIVLGKEIGSAKQAVQNNDILLCKINPRLNRVWIVDKISKYRLMASSEWIVFRNPYIYSPYMRIYLTSHFFCNLMLTNLSGVGGSLTRAQPEAVKKYPIIVPPLNEQKRIVEKVQELMQQIEQIEKSLA